jgi:rSAM/selenodomain-associated transferase 2
LSFEKRPELCVVVPVLNEEPNIAPLLHSIALQREVRLELIVSDGGSADGSVAEAARLSRDLPFPVKTIAGEKGRAGQMNLAAGAALAPVLLFLHADSRFPDPLSLRKGLDALAASVRSDGPRVAGHFSLEFHFEGPSPLPYRFYGAKAALDRPGCTHGDQGFLIGSDFFAELGGFPRRLPFMEDTLLAERIRKVGRWLLLPARIRTSPRRFLTEGLLQRQTLNAILMNLVAIGQLQLIESLKQSYRSQHQAERLRLDPLFARLAKDISGLPPLERRRMWYETGCYVRSNAWQIAFFFDLLFGGVIEGKGGRFLALHDRYLHRLVDNRLGNWAAAALVKIWFVCALRAARS